MRILVDSGSQQEPLCSAAVARRLGAEGKLVSYATQAGGQPLPIYDVGWCDLTVNGRAHPTRFRSAPIAPYDVILGESWLREHRGVLDYADNMLWQKDREGQLQPLVLDLLPHSLVGCPEVLAAAPPCAVPDGPAVMPIVSGARARRAERRHASPVESARRLGLFEPKELHAVLDFAKELPEDAELDLSDIPGVTPGPPSFDFVEADVRLSSRRFRRSKSMRWWRVCVSLKRMCSRLAPCLGLPLPVSLMCLSWSGRARSHRRVGPTRWHLITRRNWIGRCRCS